MSLLRSVLKAVSPLVIAATTLSAGCTVPYKSIACTTASDCPTQEQIAHETFDGGQNQPPPITACCTGICVIPSSGCDSGYRLVSKHSDSYDVSVCAPTSLMCEEQLADMTTPTGDMSM